MDFLFLLFLLSRLVLLSGLCVSVARLPRLVSGLEAVLLAAYLVYTAGYTLPGTLPPFRSAGESIAVSSNLPSSSLYYDVWMYTVRTVHT